MVPCAVSHRDELTLFDPFIGGLWRTRVSLRTVAMGVREFGECMCVQSSQLASDGCTTYGAFSTWRRCTALMPF